ncbi:hypothetical protein JW899_00770 [Candidatus Uhrbacteria bacterium]|nr:hypothetical protein [Candidatus Uhrbacteria bacterium]
MSIKTRIAIYLAVLLLGLAAFAYVSKPTWSPWYCGQFSGFHSHAWNNSFSQSSLCVKNGCRVIKLQEMDDPDLFDDDGYLFRCVR